MSSTDVILDAGALIAAERGSRQFIPVIDGVAAAEGRFVVPAPVLAKAWRGGTRQALLSRFLNLPFVEVDLLNRMLWQAVGELCGRSGTSDVVDAAVVVCARSRQARVVITSDPDDLRRLDSGLSYWTP